MSDNAFDLARRMARQAEAAGEALSIGTLLPLQHDGLAVRQYDAIPDEQDALLPERDLAVVLADQARASASRVLAALASSPATKALDPDPLPRHSLRHAVYAALLHFGFETAARNKAGLVENRAKRSLHVFEREASRQPILKLGCR